MKKFTLHAPLSLSALIAHFQNAIADSDYKEYIKIIPQGTLAFTVKISKAGTSTLSFTEIAEKRIDNECSVMLYKMDVAFLHKAYMDDVCNWISDVVEGVGGCLIPE